MKKTLVWLAVGLVVAAAGTRVLRDAGLIDLPPNVAPIAALAMFGGAYLPKRLAFGLPLAAMLVADLFIGFYEPQIVAAVYLSFMFSGLIGLWLRSRTSVINVIGASLVGSVAFFLVTNAAVWAFDSHGLYPHTLNGLWSAYLAGLPFLKNTVIGDLGFTAVMFGAYELAVLALRRRESPIRVRA